jgi:hypothetical protein
MAWLLPLLLILLPLPLLLGSTLEGDLRLQAPISGQVGFGQAFSEGLRSGAWELRCQLRIEGPAPADLAVAAWLSDFEGHWFQQDQPQALVSGEQEVRFLLTADAPWRPVGHDAVWNPLLQSQIHEAGLIFSSAGPGEVAIHITCTSAEVPGAAPATTGILALTLPQDASGSLPGRCGQRWEGSFRPDPFPDNPYDPRLFAAEIEVTDPSGTSYRIPAFYEQPMRLEVQGDHEEAIPAGEGVFRFRHRPWLPGLHRLRLHGRWKDGPERSWPLPELQVTGEPFRGYVRVDPIDHRFFSTTDGAFFWPMGPNIRSVNDLRGAESTPLLRRTPDLGTASYAAYLDRMQAVGCNAFELWMSSWNLALEWRADWPGFHGVGRYNQGNAAKLDRILDLAWERGIRINLVLYNHGMASTGADREWQLNPHNRKNGGYLNDARNYFDDEQALFWQQAFRRYVAGRYADHPAILGWKLWSEINLTAGKDLLKPWHAQAGEAWHRLDPYDHPVTTHWAGDYRSPQPDIASLPQLDYLCIDAYHQRKEKIQHWLLAELVNASVNDPKEGLARHNKPVLITEYGAAWYAGPEPQLIVEHLSGPWAAMVSGLSGAPMLWWIEWLDQHEHWPAYAALQRFLINEDLRGRHAGSVPMQVEGTARPVWARAWRNGPRWLGYLLDEPWGTDGGEAPELAEGRLLLGDSGPTPWQIAWWDAGQGREIARASGQHPGGTLAIAVPSFRGHLAFKLVYEPQPPQTAHAQIPPEPLSAGAPTPSGP